MKPLNPERWTKLWRELARVAPPVNSFTRLMALYSEPHRHYHNAKHIAECLEEFDQSKHLASQPSLVELAIWFHDAIYDPHSTDNEERSAELAADWLRGGGVPSDIAEAVGQLVLATRSHDAAAHRDAPLMVDVDLSILGKSQERFSEYERAIRSEYDWVAQDVYVSKRAEILQGFLNRERIYHTDLFFDKYEQQARMNVCGSLTRLQL